MNRESSFYISLRYYISSFFWDPKVKQGLRETLSPGFHFLAPERNSTTISKRPTKFLLVWTHTLISYQLLHFHSVMFNSMVYRKCFHRVSSWIVIQESCKNNIKQIFCACMIINLQTSAYSLHFHRRKFYKVFYKITRWVVTIHFERIQHFYI